ncbi:DUF4012 domain-containing protein [Microbacterium hominis]|uniref:DUF4012 domain-containing protein n=1 Tax=Microbacterium hominis TaxID=162426 RepID=A0A7D4U5U5_9MICO|nr:DUF4012 domain-containing protein [Microbacterium hominis]QKJ20345.1 DUF4012 domain-containing protein [Microbacterium hominis]
MSSKQPAGRYRIGRAGNHAPAPQRRRRWPWVVGAGLAFVLLIGGVGAIFGMQALTVRDNLLEAKDKLTSVPSLATKGDQAQIETVANEVLALTTESDAIVQGPLWDLAAAVPGVGVNIAAVKSATEATHILVRDAMPPALQLLGTVQLDKLKVKGGGLNLEPFRGAIGIMPAVTAAFADAEAHVSSIDRSALMPVVDDALGQLLDVMTQAGPALGLVDKYLPTLLQLAGSDEPRTYIVLFQNNAEIRATGGNAATSAVISVDNGKIEMRDDEQSEDFHTAGVKGWLDYEMPDTTLAMYEWDFAKYAQNYSRTPDYPTTAAMFRSLWQTTNDSDVDGVISIDPVVLSYMLEATGPIELDDGSEINADNAVQLLLSDSYERFGTNGKAADAYFNDVAASVFSAVSSGDWDPGTMIEQLMKAAEEQRIYMWFSRDGEQALSDEFHLDGALTTDNTESTQVGVWVNNASYSKLEYYLTTSLDVSCDPTARTVTSTLTMTSSVPGWDLSEYTLAWRNPSLGVPRTDMLLDVVSYAVPGGTLVSSPETGDFASWTRTGSEAGRDGKSISVIVPMGETKSVSFTSTLPEGELGPLQTRFSPTVTQTPVTVADSCSSLFPEEAAPAAAEAAS